MPMVFLLQIIFYIIITETSNSKRNILKIVSEHNSQYNGGILYNFWVESNGVIYGNSYGINTNIKSMTSILPKTPLVTPNANEKCVSVDVDYIYDPTATFLMFNPINIMLATSCKYCMHNICSQWRILTMNIDGNTFTTSSIIDVATFHYKTSNNSEIFVNLQKYGNTGLFSIIFNAINEDLTPVYSSRIFSGYVQPFDQIMVANYNISTLEFHGHVDFGTLYPEYGLLTLNGPYLPSFYPISIPLYSTDYIIHCHIVDDYGQNAINCALLNGNTQRMETYRSVISQSETDIFKHKILLTAIDNHINRNMNPIMSVCDMIAITNVNSENKAKIVIVYETGYSIFGEIRIINMNDYTFTQYILLNEIPINSYNLSYNPVTTTINDTYFVIAWIVKEKGIYAALYNDEGMRATVNDLT
eukprot:270634_1